MSERLEEMLRIARAATKGAWYEDSRGREHSEHDPLYYVVQAEMNKLPVTVADTLNCDSCLTADEQHANAQHIATFNPRTAEALVKGMQVLADIATSSNVLAAPAKAHHAMAEFTAAMEDNSNVG